MSDFLQGGRVRSGSKKSSTSKSKQLGLMTSVARVRKVIAQHCNLRIAKAAPAALAGFVDFYVGNLVSKAHLHQKNAKRETIQTEDINLALQEPVFASCLSEGAMPKTSTRPQIEASLVPKGRRKAGLYQGMTVVDTLNGGAVQEIEGGGKTKRRSTKKKTAGKKKTSTKKATRRSRHRSRGRSASRSRSRS